MNVLLMLAALKLAAPFTDGAVLQRQVKVPLWGEADPYAAVKASFAGKTCATTAASNGIWRLDLGPFETSSEGRELMVVAGTERRVVKDVLVGEVWLCAGQSNMGIPFWGESPRARERLGFQVGQLVNRPQLRFAVLENNWSDVPRREEIVRWCRATPAFMCEGGFSAIGCWYGLILQTTLDVPVGIIGAYVGATDIETWIPDCRTPPPRGREKMDGQNPSQYYNGKLAPIVPYAMRGAIWYQGESNTDRSSVSDYASRMHDLHDGFKRVFENSRYRLYFCQLCPWGSPLVPFMQEQQAKFAREDPDAGMAVLCDVGNLNDIHPNDKQTPALRLSLLALRRDYGFAHVVSDSPTLRSWKVEEGRFKLAFDGVKSWAIYDPDWRHHREAEKSTEDYGFEVAGADGVWTKARIANLQRLPGVSVVEYRGQITNAVLEIYAPTVAEPKALRYLFSRPWRGYLMNEAGLPLGSFRIGDAESDDVLRSKAASGTMKPIANY